MGDPGDWEIGRFGKLGNSEKRKIRKIGRWGRLGNSGNLEILGGGPLRELGGLEALGIQKRAKRREGERETEQRGSKSRTEKDGGGRKKKREEKRRDARKKEEERQREKPSGDFSEHQQDGRLLRTPARWEIRELGDWGFREIGGLSDWEIGRLGDSEDSGDSGDWQIREIRKIWRFGRFGKLVH